QSNKVLTENLPPLKTEKRDGLPSLSEIQHPTFQSAHGTTQALPLSRS
ncbi:21860_t:CDS:1, partial [Gigaspora rosea]